MHSQTVTASAPGRVNLMGEHTDYNDGLVLPMPIPQRTIVSVRPRSDTEVNVASQAFGGTAHYELGAEQRQHGWIDYVQGVTQRLTAEGHTLRGFDAKVASSVPLGAGLSSSASLLVAVLRALREAFELTLDGLEIARLAQAVEVTFIGVPVGAMDPMVISLGSPGEALFIDTRSLQTEAVALPAKIELIVIDSGVSHSLESGDYAKRRAECMLAAKLLGLGSLRDYTPEHAPLLATLDPVLQRRVRHVVSENERVLATRWALERDELAELGLQFMRSHLSMRSDYEVSTPEVDRLVDIGCNQPQILGARLTGGGFGGSVVMLAHRGEASVAAREIAANYATATGCKPRILLPVLEEASHEQQRRLS